MRKLLITIASVCITSMIYAQSPVFSQYYTTAAYLNPALVGSESDITLGLNYRAQWNQLESPYKTVQFSYMHPLLEQGGRTRHMGGVGFSVLNDQFILDKNHASLDLSEYELIKEYDATKYYQVTEQNSNVVFDVTFYFYGGIISGWSVEPEKESFEKYKDGLQ